jgi:hypothetical protein
VEVGGRRLGGRNVALVLGLCAALAGAGFLTVRADAAGEEKKLPAQLSFSLQASNGYRMFVLAPPGPDDEPASVLVFLENARGEGVVYGVPATVTESSIQASLGALGLIDVAFHADGSTRVSRSKCAKPVSFPGGTYDGTISFHGENGFTSVDATSAPGDLDFLTDFLCGEVVGHSGGPGAELEVGFGSSLGPHLRVVKNRPRGVAHFEVVVNEWGDGVVISRFAAPTAPAGTFRFDPKLRAAMVRPPAPFSGHGVYRRSAKPGHRWTGNLSVDLPGRDDVPITGRNLRVTLRHAHWDFSPRAASRLTSLARAAMP